MSYRAAKDARREIQSHGDGQPCIDLYPGDVWPDRCGLGIAPFGVKDVGSGRIKKVARGSDVQFSDQSVRVMIAKLALWRPKERLRPFHEAYRETLDWLYSDKSALDAYATWAGTDAALAKQVREEFYPKQNPSRISEWSGQANGGCGDL